MKDKYRNFELVGDTIRIHSPLDLLVQYSECKIVSTEDFINNFKGGKYYILPPDPDNKYFYLVLFNSKNEKLALRIPTEGYIQDYVKDIKKFIEVLKEHKLWEDGE